MNNLKETVSSINNLAIQIKDGISLIEELRDNNDPEMFNLVEETFLEINKQLEKLEIEILLNGEFDHQNCVIDIHSGAGGTEACDWANMLYRMYTRWCEKEGYKINIIDYQDGDTTGVKSVSIEVIGVNAYGYLKCEVGVHRLVRLSPFDSSNKRHTSFASVEVIPETEEIEDIVLDSKDLRIDVYRSSGAGGQGVNTTDSAVRITHLPTKIVVTSQNERSQIQNKEQALKVLKNKVLFKLKQEELAKKGELKSEQKNIEFGSQIRSYVMHPYMMVKDHRTKHETSNVNKVLDGDLTPFMEALLKGG